MIFIGDLDGGRRDTITVVEYQGHLSHGCHDPEGVFVAYGPGIRQGVRLPAVNVVDVTPTVLYGLDLAVPSGLDGRVLADVFEPAQVAATRYETTNARPRRWWGRWRHRRSNPKKRTRRRSWSTCGG